MLFKPARHLLRPFLLLFMLVTTALLAAPLAAGTAATDDDNIAFEGSFEVTQGDGPNCGFSDTPFTAGDVAFAVLPIGSQGTVFMDGGGQGVRRGLRCGDITGDLQWQVSYIIEAAGAVTVGGAEFSWPGTAEGSGSHQWLNCEENGQPVQCPDGASGSFDLPVVITGRLTCTQEAEGRIRFPTIGLTEGEWRAHVQVPPGWSLARAEGEVTLNGAPLAHHCPVLLSGTDTVQTGSSARLIARCSDQFVPAFKAAELVLAGLEENRELRLSVITGLTFESCRDDSFRRSDAATDPPLAFDLQQGSLSLLSSSGAPPMLIQAPQATAEFGGGANIKARAYAGGVSEFATLGGPLAITPANPALSPFTLQGAQQVAVGETEVSAVIDLSQVSLPYISRAD